MQTEKSGTLGTGNDQTIFAAIPINDKATRWQGGGESRNHDGSGNGLGIGKEGDPSPTLTAGDRHGVMCGNQVPLTYGIGNGQSHEAGIWTTDGRWRSTGYAQTALTTPALCYTPLLGGRHGRWATNDL